MTQQARIRRLGWIATLSICALIYVLLHIKVNAVHSEVVLAEQEIVRLEQRNTVLETEVLARSSQVKLTQWNRVEFGYHAPLAEQYIDSERRLAELGSPRDANAPPPIRLATITTGEDAPPFPGLAERRRGEQMAAAQLALTEQGGIVRVAISDVASSGAMGASLR